MSTLHVLAVVGGMILGGEPFADPVAGVPLDTPASPERIDAAVRGGLGFLTDEMVRWKQDRGCASCHHAGQMMWALAEARAAGFSVNDAALAEVASWALAVDNRATPIAGPINGVTTLSMGAVYVSLAADALPQLSNDDQAGLRRMAEHIVEKQDADGGWTAGGGRPPLFDGRLAVTLLSQMALEALPAKLADAAPAATRERAAAFLAAQRVPPTSQQVLCLQLVTTSRQGTDSAAIGSQCDAIFALQQPDGGWRQTDDLPVDAFATAQAVYALRCANVPVGEPRLARGLAWLVNRQAADGSWSMHSRPRHDGRPPAQDLRPISYAATAWATMALARCSDENRRQ